MTFRPNFLVILTIANLSSLSAVHAGERGSVRVVPNVAPAPAHNPLTAEKVELGRELFFDTRLSATKTVSCQSCHDVLKDRTHTPSGTDNLQFSIGVFGAHGGRNAPTVWNSGLRLALFWDGRVSSLEEQAKGPMMNPVEMGMPSGEAVVKAVQAAPGYPEKFRKAFGHPKAKTPYQITLDDIAMAIASFERTLITPHSPFDRYQLGEKDALSASALRGWRKFQEHACIACHAAPTFDNRDYFIRFPLHEAKIYDKRYGFTRDDGRFNVTHDFKDLHSWRVPSLQNVELTAPYFHNGSVDSLEEAVRVMAKAQLQKTLPDQDVKDIVEFLKSLTGRPDFQTAPLRSKRSDAKP